MPILEYLLAFENFPFLFALLMGIIFTVGSAIGIGHTDVDVDADAHADIDTDHSVAHTHEIPGHDQHGGNPLDTQPDQHLRSRTMRVLSFFGIGKVPFSVILTTACFLFGITGMVANQFLAPVFKIGAIYGWMSLGAALFVTIALTGRFARLVNRIMPSTETYPTHETDLVGCVGTTELTTTETFGRANVRSPNGDLHTIACRTESGSIPSGAEVYVAGYDAATRTYLVSTENATLRLLAD